MARKKLYSIEAAGRDPEIMRDTAKNVQARCRQLHASGIPAQIRGIINAAEKRTAMATLIPSTTPTW
jgi:hypothetical protein